jgi:uncharacterized protein (TIGR03000 family)
MVFFLFTGNPTAAAKGGHGGHGGGGGHGGFHGHHGHYGYGWGGYYGYGWGGYYGYGWGYPGFGWGYPGWGWDGYLGYGYGWGGYGWAYPAYYAPLYDPGYGIGFPGIVGSSPPVNSGNRPPVAAALASENTAHFHVRAPGADTELWLNGVHTKQTGTDQWYTTPPITPGEKYAYDIRARWTENGKSVELTRTVAVQANERIVVDLSKPAGTADDPQKPTSHIAHLRIRSPARETELWLNGVRTKQTGAEQRYQTPPITPGETYCYDIKARWTENGNPFEVTRTISLKAAETISVDLAERSLTARK